MMKTSFALLVTAMTSMLAGCSLYFGDGNDHNRGDGTWNYCGSDGYYECKDESCIWRGPTCPDSDNPMGGFECTQSTDCAAGCYCANGTCEEAGFCTQDSDCGTGYVCNKERSSCEPTAPVTTCETDTNCPNGQTCSPDSHTCVATCTCATDQQAASQGYDYCDEWRATCMNGTDPAGTCAGEPTCNIVPPTCAAGDVPLLGADGCWTGECEAASQCADAPACKRINDSASCAARSDCHRVFNGINCTKNDGSGQACQDGDVNCTCAQYIYSSCAAN